MRKKINMQLAKEIKEMFDADQVLRMLWNNPELTKPLSQRGKSDKRVAKNKLNWGLVNYLVYFIDATHNSRIHRIIQRYGYPSQKLIGKTGMRHFWLLAQHQDYDSKLQEECLKRCDFQPKDKAFLTDRVLVNSGKKQIYGTQFEFNSKEKKFIPKPTERGVEKLRREIGLDTLKEDTNKINALRNKANN